MNNEHNDTISNRREVQLKTAAHILVGIIEHNTQFCPQYYHSTTKVISCKQYGFSCNECIVQWAIKEAAVALNGVETFLQDENGDLV